jgi:hypothetical protein
MNPRGRSRRRRASRWPGVTLGVAILVVAAVTSVAWVLVPRIARTWIARGGCAARSVAWVGVTSSAPGLRVDALTCPGLQAARAELRPRLDGMALMLEEVRFDAKTRVTKSESGSGRGDGFDLPGLVSEVSVQGLDVTWGDSPLVDGLSGSLVPLSLSGPGVSVAAKTGSGSGAGGSSTGAVHIEVERDLAFSHVSGHFAFDGSLDLSLAAIDGMVWGTGVRVEHPLLAGQPLRGLSFVSTVAGTWDPSLVVSGDLELAGVRVDWHVSHPEAEMVFEAEIADTPVAELLRPLAPLVPELRYARVDGQAGGRLSWKGGTPALEPRLEKLHVIGAVPAGVRLDVGPFDYLVHDENDEVVKRRTGEGTAGWTRLDDVSHYVPEAIVAAEDASFYRHSGWDLAAIRDALAEDLEAGEVRRGASTLTQQLAKNLFLDGEQTLVRKIREILLAAELDRTLGKHRVMELYLNVVEWGPGIYGIHEAAETYLLKDPSRIGPLEAAFLASMLPSPRRYYRSWYLGGRPNRLRVDAILDNMVLAGFLSSSERDRVRQADLRLVPPPRAP